MNPSRQAQEKSFAVFSPQALQVALLGDLHLKGIVSLHQLSLSKGEGGIAQQLNRPRVCRRGE